MEAVVECKQREHCTMLACPLLQPTRTNGTTKRPVGIKSTLTVRTCPKDWRARSASNGPCSPCNLSSTHDTWAEWLGRCVGDNGPLATLSICPPAQVTLSVWLNQQCSNNVTWFCLFLLRAISFARQWSICLRDECGQVQRSVRRVQSSEASATPNWQFRFETIHALVRRHGQQSQWWRWQQFVLQFRSSDVSPHAGRPGRFGCDALRSGQLQAVHKNIPSTSVPGHELGVCLSSLPFPLCSTHSVVVVEGKQSWSDRDNRCRRCCCCPSIDFRLYVQLIY